MKKDIKQKFILKLIPVFLLTFVLCNSLDERVYATEVQAEVEEATTETAYIDMSSVSPLTLNFTEDEINRKPDYYYAALAFNILNERIAMDSMYRNCREVIVTIDQMNATEDVMRTTFEPKVQTGYLNLLSKETNKCYTIDNVIIRIQR